jgi:integrase
VANIYYFRIRVPHDLVEVEGKKVIQESLRTKDPDVARRLNSQKQAEVRERWARMRLGVIVLDDRQIEAISGEVYKRVWRYFGDNRNVHVLHNQAGLLWGLLMAMDELPVPENGEVDSWGMIESIVGPRVREVLDKHGLRVDQRSWRRLLWAGARAAKQAMELILKEGEGDYTGDPKANRFPKLELPEGVGNAEDAAQRSLVRRGLTAENARSGRRGCPRSARRRIAGRLMAYTGARVNEVTQLRACDVGIVDGVWCVTFTPEAGTIKGNKPRSVPIHPHLIEQGLLDYAASFDGATPIFHNSTSTNPKNLAKAAEAVGGHLATWVRELGVTGPDVAPNHGWRHRFASYAPTLMQEIQLNNIQGHAPATAGRKYIKIPPSELAPIIQRIPRYDIPGAGKVGESKQAAE